MTDTDIYEAAKRGAALLDVEEPGWFNYLDADNLDMSWGEHNPEAEECGCVLSQINAVETGDLGTYDDGVWTLFGHRDEFLEAQYGFIMTWGANRLDYDPEQRSEDWEALTDAWKSLIKTRQEAQ